VTQASLHEEWKEENQIIMTLENNSRNVDPNTPCHQKKKVKAKNDGSLNPEFMD
jgi:hypothetical protein